MNRDIFEDMRQRLSCSYISDLPCNKRAVWEELKRLCPSDYPPQQLEDFSCYVFGVHYPTIEEALHRKDVKMRGRT